MAFISGPGRTRQWADLLAIIVGVTLVGLAMWPGAPTASPEAAEVTTYPEIPWYAHFIAGITAIAGVVVAQRWSRRGLGRGLLIGAAVVLLAALLVFRVFDWRAWLTLVLPAVLLLVTAFGIGPAPRD